MAWGAWKFPTESWTLINLIKCSSMLISFSICQLLIMQILMFFINYAEIFQNFLLINWLERGLSVNIVEIWDLLKLFCDFAYLFSINFDEDEGDEDESFWEILILKNQISVNFVT